MDSSIVLIASLCGLLAVASCASPQSGEPAKPDPETNAAPVAEVGDKPVGQPVSDAPPVLAADAHMHLDKNKGDDLVRVRKVLKEAGYARAAAISPGYRVAPDCDVTDCAAQRAWTVSMNDWAIEQLLPAKRVVVLCGVPLGYSWAHEEAARCLKAGGKGIKLHTERDGLSLTDPNTAEQVGAILEAASARGVPLLIHVRFQADEVDALFTIAEANPEATVIVAHQLGPMMPMLMKAPENVSTEISGLTLVTAEQRTSVAGLWRGFGLDRILLGSDWPELDPKEHLTALREMGFTDSEVEAVSRRNFDDVFGE